MGKCKISVWDKLDVKLVEYPLERDFTGNRAWKIGATVGEIKLYIWIHHLEIRKKVGEIKLYIWIHQQIVVEVKVVDTVT